MTYPLIVTLTLDPKSQSAFDTLRRQYFPPARLFIGAHVTMFHAIPPEYEVTLLEAAAAACADTCTFPVRLKSLRFLGRGVAYDLAAPEALALRARIAAALAGRLTRQDSARWQPHITVQNKVDPDTARATYAALSGAGFPSGLTADGMAVWRYLGGPWQEVAQIAFTKDTVLF